MDNKDSLQQELMRKLAEIESKNKRRFSPYEGHLRLQRDMQKMQGSLPAISKDVFCSALKLIKEQKAVDDEFSKALQTVGNGHFVFGTENKYRRALLMVLKEAVNDVYDYIDWWLYEGAPDYEIWSADEEEKWELREPEALYEYITSQDSK